MDKLGFRELEELEQDIIAVNVYTASTSNTLFRTAKAATRIVGDYLHNECGLTDEAVEQMYKFIPVELINNMAADFQNYYAEEIQEWASTH